MSPRVQKAQKPGSGRPTWLVLGDDCFPIGPIDEQSSPNTVRAYAHHLKLYWEYLTEVGLDWRAAALNDVINFVGWLRWSSPGRSREPAIREQRKPSTINAIIAAVTAFRVYQARAGSMADQIHYQLEIEPGRPYKPFLHHVTKGRPIPTRIVKVKTYAPLPRMLSDEDLKRVISACRHLRDKFLIRLLAETEMRIGQALGLRHSDLNSWDNEIWIVSRDDNVNGAHETRGSRATAGRRRSQPNAFVRRLPRG